MKKNWLPLVLVTATVLTVAVLSLSSCTRSPETTVATPTPPASPGGESILPSPAPSVASSGAKTVTVFKVVDGTDGSKLEKVEMPVEAGMDTPDKIAVAALNHMAEMPESPLPKGAKANTVTFESNLATVDFNKAFQENFEGGDRREALLFNAITATLGQFPDVKKVQITVEGKKVPIGGTQDTTEPLSVPSHGEGGEGGHEGHGGEEGN